MPRRPNTEELVEFLRNYQNLSAMDVDQFWRSVAPELQQLVARPIDIIETVPFRHDVIVTSPGAVNNLTHNFGPTTQARILVVRQVRVQDTGAGAPDAVTLAIAEGAANWPFAQDTAPVAGDSIVGGAGAFSRMVAAVLPVIIYPTQTLEIDFFIAIAAAMQMRVIAIGEEFEAPLRNVAT